MSDVTIYHNPDCGTSRNTLAAIRACGIEPVIIEYLKTPPGRDTLVSLIARMKMPVRDVLRVKGTAYKALGLDDLQWTDEQLLQQMQDHPILMNRPIVVTALGVRLCRPSDVVLSLLPRRPPDDARKEDGSPFLFDGQVPGRDPGLVAALKDAQLPTEDLDEPGCSFFAYRTASGECVGYGGFERTGRDVLVRSLVVLPPGRRRGVGGGLLALLLRRAFDEGGRDAWLLTTSAAAFFERCVFRARKASDSRHAGPWFQAMSVQRA